MQITEHCNLSSNFKRCGKFLDQLKNCQLLKQDSNAWSCFIYLVSYFEKSLLFSCTLELCVCVITDCWFILQIAVHSGKEMVTQQCRDRKYRIFVLGRFCTEIQGGAVCCSLVGAAIVR